MVSTPNKPKTNEKFISKNFNPSLV